MKKFVSLLLAGIISISGMTSMVLANDLQIDKYLIDNTLFSVASFNPSTGETTIEEKSELEKPKNETIFKAEPYEPKSLEKSAMEMDAKTKADLAGMRLLTENGDFDFETWSELPTTDDNFSSYNVIGPDNRMIVSNTTLPPLKFNCYLAATFPNGNTYRGTAFTMGPNIAGTCGHNLFQPSFGGWATSVVIIAARDGSYHPYGSASSTTLHVGGNWYNGQHQNDDWGMVELSSNVGNNVGYYGMRVSGSAQVGQLATITGYPLEVQGYTNNYYMWKDTYYIDALVDNMYRYTIDTSSGQSGSAIHDDSYMIGIHSYGGATYNSGRILDQWLFNFFMNYR